jgi:hypothetical protein
VHVCRRWRNVVFGSPRRLNLQLFCSPGTPRDVLDVWPALRLFISDRHWRPCPVNGTANIVALLEHSDRVSQINFLKVPSLHFFFGKRFGNDAEAIPGVDGPSALVI